MKKVVLTANTSWYVFNFRSSTINALLKNGYEVFIVVPDDNYKKQLLDLGAKLHCISMKPKSKNIFNEIVALYSYFKAIVKIKPDVVLSFTPKSNIYVSLVSKLTKTKVISNVSGLGGSFNEDTFWSRLYLFLYKIAFSNNFHVFFQNEDDMKILLEKGCVESNQSSRIFGSGVDLNKFRPCVKSTIDINFIFIARFLKKKGVLHFLNAADILKKKYQHVSFSVLGTFDSHEYDITPETFKPYIDSGAINFLGASDTVSSILNDYHAVVLPSYYREGVPKTLLEAAASGLAIITTNNVGCRDVVTQGYNGFICDSNNLNSLMDAIEKYIDLDANERIKLGINSREFAEKYCDEEIIIDEYISCVNKACNNI